MSMISSLIDKLNKSADEWNGSNWVRERYGREVTFA